MGYGPNHQNGEQRLFFEGSIVEQILGCHKNLPRRDPDWKRKRKDAAHSYSHSSVESGRKDNAKLGKTKLPKANAIEIPLKYRPPVLDTPEAIAKWREQRRRNFPTAANIERKKVEAQKRKSRGELETKPEPRPRLKKPSVASAGLLRKMLQGEIRKEHTLVLQCLRFISEESFFQDGGSVKAWQIAGIINYD